MAPPGPGADQRQQDRGFPLSDRSFRDVHPRVVLIGVVVALLTSQWHLSTAQVSLLNSVTLGAFALGALAFGRSGDLLGRTRIYGLEALILAAGAITSALSPNFTFLLVSRLVIGIGIGGDCPVSATIMSECSGKRSRAGWSDWSLPCRARGSSSVRSLRRSC